MRIKLSRKVRKTAREARILVRGLITDLGTHQFSHRGSRQSLVGGDSCSQQNRNGNRRNDEDNRNEYDPEISQN